MTNMMTKSKVKSNALVSDGVGTDILQGSVLGAGAMAAGLIGAWAVSCMISGMIAAGGPIALISSWFSAVTGM